jgi:hypothetical protein
MSISSKIKCQVTEFLANMKCPKCFSKKVTPCECEMDDKAKCEECGCEFELDSDVPIAGME